MLQKYIQIHPDYYFLLHEYLRQQNELHHQSQILLLCYLQEVKFLFHLRRSIFVPKYHVYAEVIHYMVEPKLL